MENFDDDYEDAELAKEVAEFSSPWNDASVQAKYRRWIKIDLSTIEARVVSQLIGLPAEADIYIQLPVPGAE